MTRIQAMWATLLRGAGTLRSGMPVVVRRSRRILIRIVDDHGRSAERDVEVRFTR
jgi:hypothetical protein